MTTPELRDEEKVKKSAIAPFISPWPSDSVSLTEVGLRRGWEIPSQQGIDRENARLMEREGVVKIGVFGSGAAGVEAAEAVVTNGGMAIVFAEDMGGEPEVAISEYVHPDGRRDNKGRTLMKGLNKPGIFYIPRDVGSDPTMLELYVKRFHLDGIIVAGNGQEHKSTNVDYSIPGVHTADDLLKNMRHLLDYPGESIPNNLSAQGSVPKLVVVEGGNDNAKDVLVVTRITQALEVLRQRGVDVTSLDARSLLQSPRDAKNAVSDIDALRYNLKHLGISMSELGKISLIQAKNDAEMEWLKPSDEDIARNMELYKKDVSVTVAIDTIIREAAMHHEQISPEVAIHRYMLQHDEGFRYATRMEVQKWIDGYAANLIHGHTIRAVTQRPDGMLRVSVGEELPNIVADMVVTSSRKESIVSPKNLSVPVRVIGADPQQTTHSLLYEIQRHNGHPSPASENIEVLDEIHRVWQTEGFNGNLVDTFVHEAPPSYFEPFRHAEDRETFRDLGQKVRKSIVELLSRYRDGLYSQMHNVSPNVRSEAATQINRLNEIIHGFNGEDNLVTTIPQVDAEGRFTGFQVAINVPSWASPELTKQIRLGQQHILLPIHVTAQGDVEYHISMSKSTRSNFKPKMNPSLGKTFDEAILSHMLIDLSIGKRNPTVTVYAGSMDLHSLFTKAQPIIARYNSQYTPPVIHPVAVEETPRIIQVHPGETTVVSNAETKDVSVEVSQEDETLRDTTELLSDHFHALEVSAEDQTNLLPMMLENIRVSLDGTIVVRRVGTETDHWQEMEPKEFWTIFKRMVKTGRPLYTHKREAVEQLNELLDKDPYMLAAIGGLAISAIHSLAGGDPNVALGASYMTTLLGLATTTVAGLVEFVAVGHPKVASVAQTIRRGGVMTTMAALGAGIPAIVHAGIMDHHTVQQVGQIVDHGHPTAVPTSTPEMATVHSNVDPHIPQSADVYVRPDVTSTASHIDLSAYKYDWAEPMHKAVEQLGGTQGWVHSVDSLPKPLTQAELIVDWSNHLHGKIPQDILQHILDQIAAAKDYDAYMKIRESIIDQVAAALPQTLSH